MFLLHSNFRFWCTIQNLSFFSPMKIPLKSRVIFTLLPWLKLKRKWGNYLLHFQKFTKIYRITLKTRFERNFAWLLQWVKNIFRISSRITLLSNYLYPGCRKMICNIICTAVMKSERHKMIIWWLIFEKNPFQFWREIWI